tara:strand:+ start:137 stop:1693 length:1557 start_codon:yes stop_codon:yes gene_type:complete
MENFNEEQKRAYERIKRKENVLIFGQGGSGKSYLIDNIKNDKMLCLAPTGMAAINMNEAAQTIHSILKIGPKSLQAWNWAKVKDTIEKKKNLLKEFLDKYECIVFDEGSMIISGLFDTLVNTFWMVYDTDSSILFGNKQIIFMMDPLQLPCVKNSAEPYLDFNTNYNNMKKLTKSDYIVNNPFFKRLFNKEKNNIIHFTGNERCKDQLWCDVLSACRTGFKECSREEKTRYLDELENKRHSKLDCINKNEENNPTRMDEMFDMMDTITSGEDKNELAKKYENNTKTTLRKTTVQNMNNGMINKLERSGALSSIVSREPMISKASFVKAKKNILENAGTLYVNSINYMDDLGGYYSIREKNGFITTMKVVVGGRVMLRTNSIEHSKLMNGSLGVIEDIIIEGGIVKSIMVNFDGIDDGPINIKEIMFEHPEISEIKIKAFPLIPAFAITIHKLQGQTINSPLFIDYNDIPYKESKYHLLYTAISRCKNPNDVYIISENKITEEHFPVDPIMYQWYCENK